MSSDYLTQRILSVKPSATMAVNAKANALRNEGIDIINLSAGEPDFDTPDFIKEAGIEAINNNQTRYTAADGTASLKKAICHKLARDNHLIFHPSDVIATSGAKQALYNLCEILLETGCEAIIPAPYWVSYPDMVALAGADPVIIPTTSEQGFKITPQQLKAAISDKTRLLFLNSPSNPSGACYTQEELIALGEVLKQHPNIIIASDDIYEYIYWGEEP